MEFSGVRIIPKCKHHIIIISTKIHTLFKSVFVINLSWDKIKTIMFCLPIQKEIQTIFMYLQNICFRNPPNFLFYLCLSSNRFPTARPLFRRFIVPSGRMGCTVLSAFSAYASRLFKPVLYFFYFFGMVLLMQSAFLFRMILIFQISLSGATVCMRAKKDSAFPVLKYSYQNSSVFA